MPAEVLQRSLGGTVRCRLGMFMTLSWNSTHRQELSRGGMGHVVEIHTRSRVPAAEAGSVRKRGITFSTQ